MAERAYVAIDFETYYTKDYSLKNMSTWNYVFNEKFDAYLVSAYSDKHNRDVSYVGHPKDFDWSVIHGAILIAHNAGFDALVVKRLRQDGVIPDEYQEAGWFDTADCSVYHNGPRHLKGAVKVFLDHEISKEARDKMIGKHVADKEGTDYALGDSVEAFELAMHLKDTWPESELRISNNNREKGWLGIPTDVKGISEAAVKLRLAVHDCESSIPWIDDGEKPLSPKALRRQARQEGIPVPASLAKTKPEVIKWELDYADEHTWINAVRNYRSINILLKRVESLEQGVREDGTFPYQLKYFGANTGRYSGGGSGGGKFNIQNMPRKEMYGVNLRGLFQAPDGYVFVIVDYGQIEARVLLWIANDLDMISAVHEYGNNVYLAYAAKAWDREISKGTDDYQLAKAQVLGLGYQCGAPRFRALAAAEPYFIKLSEQESQQSVDIYRATNKKVVSHWHSHQKWLRMSASAKDDSHEVELRSGRVLTYPTPRFRGKDIYAQTQFDGPFKKLHSGIITNNEVQGTARDILCDADLLCEDNNYDSLFSVHDELVFLRPEDTAEQDIKVIEDIMVNASDWAKGCPLTVEGNISKVYCK